MGSCLDLTKYQDDFKNIRKNVLARHYYFLGSLQYKCHETIEGRKAFFKAVLLSPLNIKYWGLLFCGLLGEKNCLRLLGIKDVVKENYKKSFFP